MGTGAIEILLKIYGVGIDCKEGFMAALKRILSEIFFLGFCYGFYSLWASPLYSSLFFLYQSSVGNEVFIGFELRMRFAM